MSTPSPNITTPNWPLISSVVSLIEGASNSMIDLPMITRFLDCLIINENDDLCIIAGVGRSDQTLRSKWSHMHMSRHYAGEASPERQSEMQGSTTGQAEVHALSCCFCLASGLSDSALSQQPRIMEDLQIFSAVRV